MGLRQRARERFWRQLGFSLSEDEMARVETFFDSWFPVYNSSGADCYRTQAALFGVHNGMVAVLGEALPDRERRQAISAVRAGYCVAVVERLRGDRKEPEPNLQRLFGAMDEHETPERDRHDDGPGVAILLGERIGRVAVQAAVDDPEVARHLPGFGLREAVFADLRATLFTKLMIARTSTVHPESAELVMRVGHTVGVCDEALPRGLAEQ